MKHARFQRFQVISPDGFSLFMNKTYFTINGAEKDIKKWIKRFEPQGYYSSNSGKISLEELKDLLVFKII
jgi:hypothetical protein